MTEFAPFGEVTPDDPTGTLIVELLTAKEAAGR